MTFLRKILRLENILYWYDFLCPAKYDIKIIWIPTYYLVMWNWSSYYQWNYKSQEVFLWSFTPIIGTKQLYQEHRAKKVNFTLHTAPRASCRRSDVIALNRTLMVQLNTKLKWINFIVVIFVYESYINPHKCDNSF